MFRISKVCLSGILTWENVEFGKNIKTFADYSHEYRTCQKSKLIYFSFPYDYIYCYSLTLLIWYFDIHENIQVSKDTLFELQLRMVISK